MAGNSSERCIRKTRPRKIRRVTFFLEDDICEQFLVKAMSEGYSMQKVLQLLVDRYIDETLPDMQKITKIS